MKKIYILLLVFMSTFLLTGCGSDNKDKEEKNTYETPIEYYFKGIEKGNYSTAMKAFPEEFSDDITEEDFNDYIDSLKEEYGTFTIDFKITDKEAAAQSDIDEFNEYFKEEYNTNRKITEGYDVTIELTIKGSKKEDNENISLDVAKIGDNWYLLDD